jgi:hypothetical protein
MPSQFANSRRVRDIPRPTSTKRLKFDSWQRRYTSQILNGDGGRQTVSTRKQADPSVFCGYVAPFPTPTQTSRRWTNMSDD